MSERRNQLERINNEFANLIDSDKRELFETVESIIDDTEEFLESKLTIRYMKKPLPE